ncbi:hypothetical protein GOP47_0027946 [Adiantum capillus-veneris]|nr:hypothetical protein GOP47_0027946 [Adiantum capillus-veneris]
MPPPLAVFEDYRGAISSPPLFSSNYQESWLPLTSKGLHKKWDARKSSSLYKVDSWGAPYFCVSAMGTMAVKPRGCDTKLSEDIDIMSVVKKVIRPKSKGGLGLSTPIIIRFLDVLHDRLRRLQSAFDDAIQAEGYDGCFQGVFPVKCNQDRSVVENIVECGKPFGFGLEAGSKPELLLAMTCLCKGSADALLICNGYKDAEYIYLALIARKIGFNCVIVLEQEEEIDLVLNMSKKLSIDPVIGLRAKLSTKHAGHFGGTSGEKGKFGLSCNEIMTIVNKLRCADKLGCLQLLHFHIGSQIPSLAILNDGVSEAAHIYCELSLMGAGMKFIDIGGGLGVNYDGTNSGQSDMSVGYTMEEYALEVVQAVNRACTLKGVKQPTLCSESGRALVSHHSVLVFNVLSSHVKSAHMEKGVPLEVDGLPQDVKSIHTNLINSARVCDYEAAFESAKMLKHMCTELFKQGRFKLAQLAAINNIYDMVDASVEGSKRAVNTAFMDRLFDVEESNSMQGPNATYHVNLSIFRSMPDTWAIGQLFPIVPIHRLHEEPKVRATLSDLTCDSDGKVAFFIGKDKKGRSLNYLKVHELEEGKAYYIGMFLGGAYQEALGNLHNLFGSPCVVNVSKNGVMKNGFNVSIASSGQTASDVLKVMQYEPSDMIATLKIHIERSLFLCESGGDDTDNAAMGFVQALARCFTSSTYLSISNNNCLSMARARTSQAHTKGSFAAI